MTREEIITKIKGLNLPDGEYCIFGGCPLTIAGLRESNDIDILVSKKLYKHLEENGWQKIEKGPGDAPLTYDVFEVHDNWNFSSYSPTVQELLNDATLVEGIAFASLKEVRKWKEGSRIPKHLKDIELIDNYLSK